MAKTAQKRYMLEIDAMELMVTSPFALGSPASLDPFYLGDPALFTSHYRVRVILVVKEQAKLHNNKNRIKCLKSKFYFILM